MYDKVQTDLGANSTIYNAIREIAFHKLVNPRTQAFKNTSKTSGYVVKIHTDASDELCGTVDVQEYLINVADGQAVAEGQKVGYHEGVYLSALQNNENGMVVIPYLYSDVVIVTDPETLKEYVIQYSHADTIQIDAHNKVTIGVTETEEWEDSEDSPDVEELEKTGLHAHTTYTPTSILTEVAKGDEDSDKSVFEIKSDQILSQHDKAKILLDAKQILAKYNATEIVIKEDGVYLGSGSATEPGVLGNQLASLLVEWLGALSQMLTPTMMGPQAPVNVAQFASLQAKVNSYKAATSGFLSKTVKVKE